MPPNEEGFISRVGLKAKLEPYARNWQPTSPKRLRLIGVVATRAAGLAIVRRGVLQIGGPLISEHPAQLAHKMTSMRYSPGDWLSKTATM